jgi:glycosyltransferase involved in cell wall biosynthesis
LFILSLFSESFFLFFAASVSVCVNPWRGFRLASLDRLRPNWPREFASHSRAAAAVRLLMLNWRDPSNPLSGGAERVTRAYLAALRQRGHEVFWFANDFPGANPGETIDGIHIVRGGGRGTSVLKARQWYRRQPPFDLVIDQHHGIPWYAPWWSGTNCVAYIHEVLGPIWGSFYPWPISVVGRWQERWTHRLYRNVPFWTPSGSTETALHDHGIRDVKVLPNGTDATPLPALEDKPLGAPVQLIAVSRFAPNKRVDHAIRAAAILCRKNVDARLTLVGGGEMEPRLRELAREVTPEGRVRFMGRLPEAEKNAELRRAHFLVHASLREGWGLNVIEANAMGTPAIVYPVGGLVDSTVDGETGIVTREETPESLAEAIASFLKTPEKYECLRRQAWNRSKTFLWDRVLPPACDWLELQARRNRRGNDNPSPDTGKARP